MNALTAMQLEREQIIAQNPPLTEPELQALLPALAVGDHDARTELSLRSAKLCWKLASAKGRGEAEVDELFVRFLAVAWAASATWTPDPELEATVSWVRYVARAMKNDFGKYLDAQRVVKLSREARRNGEESVDLPMFDDADRGGDYSGNALDEPTPTEVLHDGTDEGRGPTDELTDTLAALSALDGRLWTFDDIPPSDELAEMIEHEPDAERRRLLLTIEERLPRRAGRRDDSGPYDLTDDERAAAEDRLVILVEELMDRAGLTDIERRSLVYWYGIGIESSPQPADTFDQLAVCLGLATPAGAWKVVQRATNKMSAAVRECGISHPLDLLEIQPPAEPAHMEVA